MNKAIILLHGWGKQAPEKIKPLGEKLKLLEWRSETLSLPGFGNSPDPSSPFSLLDYANWVVKEIKARKVAKPVLFGHSLGGQIAALIAIEALLPISGLVLCESTALRPSPSLIKQLIKKASQITPEVVKKYIRPRLKFMIPNSDYYRASEVMKKTLVNVIAEELSSRLHQINSKTLILWGENDRTVSLSLGKKTSELIPNSVLRVIPKATHSLPYTHIQETAKLITEFFAR